MLIHIPILLSIEIVIVCPIVLLFSRLFLWRHLVETFLRGVFIHLALLSTLLVWRINVITWRVLLGAIEVFGIASGRLVKVLFSMLTILRLVFIFRSIAFRLISIIFLFNVILIRLGRLAWYIPIFLVMLVGVNNDVCNDEVVGKGGEEKEKWEDKEDDYLRLVIVLCSASVYLS